MHVKFRPIMPNERTPNVSDGNSGNTRFGIFGYSTLWLKPVLVGQFEFVEWTPDNHLRNSKFVEVREDRDPREVRREVAE
jgi:ATP-dependent DNA ligase